MKHRLTAMSDQLVTRVPRTYLGLSKVLETARGLPGWSALPEVAALELLIAVVYFRVSSTSQFQQFETNDYIRLALGRKEALPIDFHGWLTGHQCQAAATGLCNFVAHMQAPLSEAHYRLVFSTEEGECVYASVPRGDDPPRFAAVAMGRYPSDPQLATSVPSNLSPWADWFSWPEAPSGLTCRARLAVDAFLSNCLIEIGKRCSMFEFRLGRQHFLSSADKNSLEFNGYLVKEGFLEESKAIQLRDIVRRIAAKEAGNGKAYFYGNGNKLQRVYNVLNKSHEFSDWFLSRGEIFEILQYFFDTGSRHTPFYLSSYQANILNPGATAQVIHVDSSVPDPLPPWKIRLNINLLLDPFTETNGATLVYPGSHKFLRKPNPADIPIEKMQKILAPAGSLVIWTGHLWHQSGANTDSHSRTALLSCFTASYLREIAVEENYLAIMDRAQLESLPFELKTVLGYFHGRKASA